MSQAAARATTIGAALAMAAAAWLAGAVAQAELVTPVDAGPVGLRLLFNPGVSFGLGDALPAWLVSAATGAITVLVLGWIWRSGWAQPRVGRWGLSAILAGAIANLVDRVPDGMVTDYLHTGWFPTFNLPDVLITLGAIVFVLSGLRRGTLGGSPAPPPAAPKPQSRP